MKYYELLDVAPEATQAEIKAAYRIQVQLHHPDRLQQVSETVRRYAEEKIKRINEAYTVLSDPVRRSAYDARWKAEQSRARSSEPREAEGGEGDWFRPRPAAGRRRRSEADAAREWMKWEAEQRQADRYAERQREAAAAEARARQEAEARARQAAQQSYPRLHQDGDELVATLRPDLPLPLVRIPAGEFRMGSDPVRDALAQAAERPQHTVRLTEYFIARQPVTYQQYQAFQQAVHPGSAWVIPDGRALHPVVNVSWEDAGAFCRWLAAPGWKFRLPSEAEWEKAARGADGRLFPWGDAWAAGRANADDFASGTTPVGMYSPDSDSPYGLADMCGNVWEWCLDWYAAEEYARRTTILNPSGPVEGLGAVIRGGAFDAPLRRARCASRDWYYIHKHRPNLGFRVAAVPVAEET